MTAVLILGRLVLGGYWIYHAVDHYVRLDFWTGIVEGWGLPLAQAGVIGTGILQLAAGVGIIVGFRPWIAQGLMLAFLLAVTFIPLAVNPFWGVENDQQRTMATIIFERNMGL